MSVEQLESRLVPSVAELVRDINLNTPGSSPTAYVDFNGTLFFNGNDNTSGDELWKSDGTAAGTTRVKDISAGAGNSSPGLKAVVGGTLFFGANDGANGAELWKSDGTEAGTALLPGQ